MLKWVVTKRGPAAAPRVPPINGAAAPHSLQPECSCDKENHCEEIIEFETNNNSSYAFNDLGNFYSPRKCRLSSGPLNRTSHPGQFGTECSCTHESTRQTQPRNGQTPLSSRNRNQLPRKKLRTRRERNKTLAMRLSEHAATPPSRTPQRNSLDLDLFNLYREPPTAKAELLQNFLNSNPGIPFEEREVKTPEGPSPLMECGQLHRQRAVRRKHPTQQLCNVAKQELAGRKVGANDSPSAFYSAFIFRELAREMLV